MRTAEEMLRAVLAESAGADALLMAAAVADFRPKAAAADKLKKRDGIPQIELEAAPDVLAAVAKMKSRPKVVVGFAAESRDLLENAAEKLQSKRLDLIAANDISATDAGFEAETNRVTLLFADGRREPLALAGKDQVADLLLARVVELLELLSA